MINFIKKAITSVEDIKTLLFNDDYRNNFDYGNIKYPCAVLTPIPSVTYSTKNLVKESYELHLAVLDVVPNDYDGDTLHRIQTNCSELGLKILRNLQVRTTMANDVKFEMIMPIEDEWLCGAMCNLQVTAKQPRCAGQPTYYEVQIESVKKVTITENGKLSIRPSEGYDAIKGIDIDVNVEGGGEPILQEKQVSIIDNGISYITADEGFDGLSKVQVDVALPIEASKTESITTNGTHTITPSNDNIAMSEVLVDVNVKPNLEEQELNVSKNGKYTLSPQEQYDGIELATINVNVYQPTIEDFSQEIEQIVINTLNDIEYGTY